MRRPTLLAVLLPIAACGGGGDDDATSAPDATPAADATPPADAGPPPGPDPLAFADQVSEAELRSTIQDLEDLGTRYTYGPGDDNARLYLMGRLSAYGLSVELDEFMVGAEPAANLVARKPGVEDPSVIFIFSAHYDSTSTDPMNDAPGADDNASGVAAVLEAARILGPQPFRYSLWFVLTAAEEQGSRGSAHMVTWMKAQALDVRGVIAPDMIGYWPLGEGDAMDILGDAGSTSLVQRMADVAQALGVAHKTWIHHGYCYGDDHTSFQEAGYPAISPMDCVEAHNIPSSGEETPHYHRTSDRIDTLHLPFTTRVTGVIVATFAALGEPLAP